MLAPEHTTTKGKTMDIINDKLYNWASEIDPGAIRQAEQTARLPIVERVALMPDAHVGLGSTVGSVIATDGAVIPAAVGVDIGCGMAAVEFNMDASDLPDDLERFLPMVEKAIPAGVGQGHDESSRNADRWYTENRDNFTSELDERLRKKLLVQFGSLGSGNHFFEVCLDERDKVWIVLHSGSRGLGNILASTHIATAKRVAERKHLGLEDKNLAYFEDTDDEFGMYVGDMLTCQDYAAANREQMLESAVAAFFRFLGRTVKIVDRINCHHNFTQLEAHIVDGEERGLWITRKGAIKADRGDRGVIPGSMGAATYIISGRGNPNSFNSCSHGAGRTLSRTEAKKRYTPDDLRREMEGKVWLSDKAKALVDEIPQSYKDIDQVMRDQEDLVSVDHVLRQVLNYKGT